MTAHADEDEGEEWEATQKISVLVPQDDGNTSTS